MIILKSVKKPDERDVTFHIRKGIKSYRFSVSAESRDYIRDPKTGKLRGSQVEYFHSFHDYLPEAEAALQKLVDKNQLVATYRQVREDEE
jgi:hypothetical protein